MLPLKAINQGFHDLGVDGAIGIQNNQFWSATLASFDITQSFVAADYTGI